MSRNETGNMAYIESVVTSREGRVSRNATVCILDLGPVVTSREGRVSRNCKKKTRFLVY